MVLVLHDKLLVPERTKSDRQALEEAIELIEDYAHWAQHSYAKDAKGRPVLPTESQATSWCALGALRKVTGSNGQARRITQAIVGSPFGSSLIRFNDRHSHDEVILLLKTALDRVEG